MKGRIGKILAAFLCITLLAGVLTICAAALPESLSIVVYVGGANASDSHAVDVIGDVDHPVATLEKAYELVCASEVGTDATANGVIVLKAAVGPDMTKNNKNFNIPGSGKAISAHKGTVTLTSNYGGVDYRTSGAALTNTRTGSSIGDICYFQLGGPTVWEDLVYNNPAGTYGLCVYAGDSFTIKSTFSTTNVDGDNDLVICAGWCRVEGNTTANIEILGGNIGTVTGATLAQGHQCITGTTNITIGGSANVRRVVAGPVQTKNSSCTMTAIGNVNVTVKDSAVVNSYDAGGASRTVTNSTLILAGGTVTAYAESSNVTNRNLTLSNITSSAYTLPSGTWSKLTVTGNSNVTLAQTLPTNTALVVNSPAVVTLAEGDTHAKDGDGTVNYVHVHNWVEITGERVSSTCTTNGTAYYECDFPNCTQEKEETLPLSHIFTDGECTRCGGKDNVVYVADGGTGDGYTATTPVATMEAAYEALFDRTDIETNAATSGTIVICGVTTVDRQFNYNYTMKHAGTITYTAKNYTSGKLVLAATLAQCSSDPRDEHRFQLGGPTRMEDLTIDRVDNNSRSLTIYVPSTLEVAESVQTVNTNWAGTYVQPVAGLTDADINSIKLSAHRGFQPMGPENSILSFTAAGELGFAYIETDVYRTKDGVLICVHDSTLARTTDDDSGTSVTQMTWEQVQQATIDTASKGYDINDADPDKLYVPTFREYLEICKKYGCIPFIELKDTRDDVTEDIIDMALEYFPPEKIVISSGYGNLLVYAHQYNPDVFIHKIWGSESEIATYAAMKNSKGDVFAGIAFDIQNLHVEENFNEAKRLIDMAKAAGLQTCLRGADAMLQVRKMFELGIDYYPTNLTSPQMLPQLKQGVEGGYSYASTTGGKIFIRGGNRMETNTGDVSIVLNGGLYDFVAPSNAEQATTGAYSVSVGGTAFVSRLIAGETGSGSAHDRTSSTVTVKDDAVVENLYLAGDLENTRNISVNILGGRVSIMSERRDGKTGTVGNLTLTVATLKQLPQMVNISNTCITGTKTLVVGGTGELKNTAAWTKLIAADGALIDLTGTYPQTLEKVGSGKFRIGGQSVTFGTIADIKEDGAAVVLGTDIPCDIVGNGTATVTWYKDNEGTKGEVLTGAPKAAGTYWVGVALAEGATDNAAVIHAAVAEQTVCFTIVHDLTEVKAEAPDCINDGILKHYTCAGCDMIFADAEGKNVLTSAVDPATGHDLTKVDADAPSCTEDGIVEHYNCSVCKKNFADAEGKNVLTSTVDPAVGHKLTKVDGKAATCTEDGIAEHYNCSVCKKNFVDAEGKTEISDVTVDAAHKLTEVDGKAATVTENGIKEHYACGSCGKLYADAEGKKELEKADIVINATGNSSDTGDKAMVVPALLLILLSASGIAVMVTGKKKLVR